MRSGVKENARVSNGKPISNKQWEEFASHLYYCQGDYDDPATYSALDKKLSEVEVICETCNNRLFYLSTPPQLYATIVERLGEAHMNVSTSPESYHAHHRRKAFRARSRKCAQAQRPDS